MNPAACFASCHAVLAKSIWFRCMSLAACSRSASVQGIGSVPVVAPVLESHGGAAEVADNPGRPGLCLLNLADCWQPTSLPCVVDDFPPLFGRSVLDLAENVPDCFGIAVSPQPVHQRAL